MRLLTPEIAASVSNLKQLTLKANAPNSDPYANLLRLPDTQSIKEEVSNENPLCRCNTIPVLAGGARTGEGEL